MRVLTASRLPLYRELSVRVSSNGTIQVQKNTYSVPPRLRGERLTVRLSDLHLEVYHSGQKQLILDRLRGEGRHQVDYRHVIWSMVKKPGGFARYRYREALFPTPLWHQAYEALSAGLPDRQADLEYLRVLHLAAATLQHEVEAAVELLLGERRLPVYAAVRTLTLQRQPEVPALAPLEPEFASYDGLLVGEAGR